MIRGGIGFFDSGVGGLSVLRACEEITRGMPIYYYGDNARAPYGNRDIYDIRAYVREAFSIFEKLDVAAAVVACNTVTALLVEELRSLYRFPILGIEPALLPAVRKHRRVLVLATNATVKSNRFQKLYKRALRERSSAKIQTVGCTDLAAEIERMASGSQVEIESLLPPLSVDGVVLGCTHYSLIKDRIAKFYGAEVFDGNQAVANRLSAVLSSLRILPKKGGSIISKTNIGGKLSRVTFYSSKSSERKRFHRSKKRFDLKRVKIAQSFYFIGSGRRFNRQFYERMFAFRNAWGKSGQ